MPYLRKIPKPNQTKHHQQNHCMIHGGNAELMYTVLLLLDPHLPVQLLWTACISSKYDDMGCPNNCSGMKALGNSPRLSYTATNHTTYRHGAKGLHPSLCFGHACVWYHTSCTKNISEELHRPLEGCTVQTTAIL